MAQTMVRVGVFLGLLSLWILPIHAQTMTIAQLIEQAPDVNETTVILEGEAILEPLERGEYVWININDRSGALGLWMSADLADRVSRYGKYDMRGDLLRIEGVFYRACEEHGGDMDVHVRTLSVIKAGYPIKHPVDVWRFTIAVILGLCALATVVFHRQLLQTWLDKSRPNVNE